MMIPFARGGLMRKASTPSPPPPPPPPGSPSLDFSQATNSQYLVIPKP